MNWFKIILQINDRSITMFEGFSVLLLALLSIAVDLYFALNSKYIFVTVICIIAVLFALFVVIDTIGDNVEKYIL